MKKEADKILRYKDLTIEIQRMWNVKQRWYQYRGADKSLARPGRKQATFPAFYGSWRFITTFTRVHNLSLP